MALFLNSSKLNLTKKDLREKSPWVCCNVGQMYDFMVMVGA
jgi:hypothetical protein